MQCNKRCSANSIISFHCAEISVHCVLIRMHFCNITLKEGFNGNHGNLAGSATVNVRERNTDKIAVVY